MQLKSLKTVVDAQDGAAKVTAIAWAPNNSKFAVVSTDRVVVLFDEFGEKQDKFAAKPGDAQTGKKGFLVKGMAFSPDSTKIALGQTDNILFIYKIGDEWGDRKVICNKFLQQSAVTCVIWPQDSQLVVFGLADGKVRVANLKSNKSQTIYGADVYCVSLCANASGKGILSGHADGTIVRYLFDSDGSSMSQGQLVRHSSAPYALCWGSSIVAAGCDKRITAYGEQGHVLQSFDYSNDDGEKEFTVACSSPSGQAVVIGSYDRLRVLNWSPRAGTWQESAVKETKYMYTISALAWKKDGSKLAVGTLCGGVEIYDCCLRRSIFKNKFEMTYVGLSQVIVKNLQTGARVILKSQFGYEIEDVKIMGNDRFLIAHTSETMLAGDLISNKLSEVPWHSDSGNAKFFFENENVCMVFYSGELSLIEYGEHEILATVRTEFMNPHLISVRLNERLVRGSGQIKRLAYLVDMKTICVMDLISGMALANFAHETNIDWLEMNETGRKLLFRDKKCKLHLADIHSEEKTTILNYCSYVQWVPLSDVVVAQNRTDLCVWYNIESPERVTVVSIKGDIVDLEKVDGKTSVVVQEGVQTVNYTLDEGLIEFGTAMEDGNYFRALQFLESLEVSSETEVMWRALSSVAVVNNELFVAERCYAAVGDVARAQYLHEINALLDELGSVSGDPMSHPIIRMKLAAFDKQLKVAEGILLEHGQVDTAIEMYQEMHKWDDAIAIAEAKRHPELDKLHALYLSYLTKSGQDDKAGEVKERNGDFLEAINLYMKANLPAKAARLALRVESLASNADLLGRIASALQKVGFHEKAGNLYEKARSTQRALDAYRKGKAYRPAVELARHSYPHEVIRLEEEWGDFLVSQKQFDAAINHYIEAGVSVKAIDTAIQAKQWNKAAQIVELQDEVIATKYFNLLAQHYASIQNYAVAERFFIRAGSPRAAVEMYTKTGKFESAYKVAVQCMEPEELSALYITQAEVLEAQGRYKEAERIYVTVNEADLAINMYKKLRMYDEMIKLVTEHHIDLLTDTHIHLAKELELEGSYSSAEHHYCQAGDWKAAANMYRDSEMWEDAFRVARQFGGTPAAKHVAYLWAKHLGGDSAVKLLQKLNFLEYAIEYAADNCAFDFAFELAQTGKKEYMSGIYLKYAMYLEDEGQFKLAEENFVKAGKAKEAVLMYVHQTDWSNAQRVAEVSDPSSLVDVLVGQARAAFNAKEYHVCENLLLRAERPELAISFYKDVKMWPEALRIAHSYAPHMLAQLQDEYENEADMTERSGEAFILQARDWESRAEYNRAIDLYLKVNGTVTSNKAVLLESWLKAVELAVKFLKDRSVHVAREVCQRLVALEEYDKAGEVFQAVKLPEEAINTYIAGGLWSQAKALASEVSPSLQASVEEKYVDYLKSKNMADTLVSVDIIAALDMYAKQGQWEKCIQQAEQQSLDVLNKYVALYAAVLIKAGDLYKALELFVEHGAPANPQNFNIYRKLVLDLFGLSGLSGADSYQTWANLRLVLHSLCESFLRKPTNSVVMTIFENMLLVAHYYAVRAAAYTQPSLEGIAAKISVSILRYSDLVPCDKAFYEAGLSCKKVGRDSLAFILLNRFLDVSEGIEEGSFDHLDASDLAGTDIPVEVPVPEKQFASEAEREEVKEWVLAKSMDNKIAHVLPADERGVYEASLVTPGSKYLPCVITGYPVLQNKVEFKKSQSAANKEDWNKFVMAAKVSHSPECQDVLRFLTSWCGSPSSSTFSAT